ncbi:hypothetical protein MTP99_002797 [Tenebrio molitor]|nr:hypothetical protein MTP99_002797 [Tenebrio molitor]
MLDIASLQQIFYFVEYLSPTNSNYLNKSNKLNYLDNPDYLDNSNKFQLSQQAQLSQQPHPYNLNSIISIILTTYESRHDLQQSL